MIVAVPYRLRKTLSSLPGSGGVVPVRPVREGVLGQVAPPRRPKRAGARRGRRQPPCGTPLIFTADRGVLEHVLKQVRRTLQQPAKRKRRLSAPAGCGLGRFQRSRGSGSNSGKSNQPAADLVFSGCQGSQRLPPLRFVLILVLRWRLLGLATQFALFHSERSRRSAIRYPVSGGRRRPQGAGEQAASAGPQPASLSTVLLASGRAASGSQPLAGDAALIAGGVRSPFALWCPCQR